MQIGGDEIVDAEFPESRRIEIMKRGISKAKLRAAGRVRDPLKDFSDGTYLSKIKNIVTSLSDVK